MPRMCLVSNLEYIALAAARQHHRPRSTSCDENDDDDDKNDDPPPPPYTATSDKTSASNNNNNNGSSTDEYETDDGNVDSSRRGRKRKYDGGGPAAERRQIPPPSSSSLLDTTSSDDVSFHTANGVDGANASSAKKNNNNDELFAGEHDDECYICDEGGELICCDYCARVYHFDCHIPVVDVDGMDDTTLWRCMNCHDGSSSSRGRTSMANDGTSYNNVNRGMVNKIIVLDTSDENYEEEDDDVVKYHKSPTKRQKVIDDDNDDDDNDDDAAADNDDNEKKIHDDNDKVGDNNHGIIPMAQDVTQTNQNNDNNEIVIDGVVIKDVQRPTVDNSNYNNNKNNNNNNNNNINNDTTNENGFVHINDKDNTKNDSKIVNNDDDDIVVIDSKEDRTQMAPQNGQPPNDYTTVNQFPVQAQQLDDGNNRTTWTERDIKLFEIGCILHGWGNWAAIQELLPTKTRIQVNAHSQSRQRDKTWLQSEHEFQLNLRWHVKNIHKIVADLIGTQLKILHSTDKHNSRKDDIDFLYFLQTKISIISSLPPKTMKDMALLGIIDRRIIGNFSPCQSMYPTLMSLWGSPSSGAYWTFLATSALVDRINGYTGTIELRRFIQDKFVPNTTVHAPPTVNYGTTGVAPVVHLNNRIMKHIREADNPHIANNSNEPPKNETANHPQIRPPVQSTAHSINKTGNKTAGSTVGKKTNKTTSHHNHDQSKPFTSGLPVRERFSEYQIDNASSITELESIRRRLLTLLDRTEIRLRGMRVAEALAGTFGKGNMEGLSTEELMTKLVGGEKESNDSIETTSDKETSTHKGHIPVTCPLCFEKVSSLTQSSSSIVTCHICEVDGMCGNCHEQCTSCRLSTCADCLMSCDGCVSNYHCSDCMGIGHGKCVSCRKNSSRGLPTKNVSEKQQGSKKMDKSTKNAVSSLSRGNQMLALEQHQHPPLNHQPLSMTQEEMERTSERAQSLNHQPLSMTQEEIKTRRERARSAAGHVVPGAMAQHQADIPATIGPLSTIPPSVNKWQFSAGSEPRATHPLEESTTSVAPSHKTSKTVAERLFSVHRFLISEAGTIGLNLSLLHSSKKCTISTVHSNSIAVDHGIEEGDEILPSHDNDDVYSHFISASKQRPLSFEVKRLYKHPGRLIARSSGAPVPHSLHRFVITTSGPLGFMIEKVDSMILLRNIAPMSVADIHGLQNDDILCIPNKKGQLQQRFSLFVDAVKGGIRPMIIEVWRAVPPITPTSSTLSVLPTIKPTTGEENVSNGVSKGTATTEVDNDMHAALQNAEKENNCIDDEDEATLPVSQMSHSLAPNASSNVYAPHAADHAQYTVAIQQHAAFEAVEKKQYQQYLATIEEKHATRYDYGDRYSEQNVRARKNSDGTVKPATAPKRLPDGTLAKPAGRQRKGMDWDAIKGCWYPVLDGRKKCTGVTITTDADNGTHVSLQKNDAEKEVEKEIICIDDNDDVDVEENVSVSGSNWVCDVCHSEFVTYDGAAECEKKHLQEKT